MKQTRIISILFVCGVLIVPFFALAEQYSSTNFIIRELVEDNGGGYGSSAGFQLFESLSQPAGERSTSNSFEVRGGLLDFPAESAESSPTPTPVSSSGGGGGTNPLSVPRFDVKGGSVSASRVVTLVFSGGRAGLRIKVSRFSDFRDAVLEPYIAEKQWDLCSGSAIGAAVPCPEGSYMVYVRFVDEQDNLSSVNSRPVAFRPSVPAPSAPRAPEEPPSFLGRIGEILEPFLPPFLRPAPPPVTPPPLEEILPRTAPFALSGRWNLFSSQMLQAFVLAPLPRDLQMLAQKFPKIKETFSRLDITKITDVKQLRGIRLYLPGVSETAGLEPVRLAFGPLPPRVRLGDLPRGAKQLIPAEVVFARGGGGVIDTPATLSVGKKGQAVQRITAVSNTVLSLAVKPESRVRSVRGYIVFKSRTPEPLSLETPFQSFTASFLFANPVFAVTEQGPLPLERELVLGEFEYFDLDGDGIYTADIRIPAAEGEYEIITVLEYEDEALGTRAIRLITVIDPEGYVFERVRGQELRVSGANVSLHALNEGSGEYELWPATEFSQQNPQITDATGRYAFLVPEGTYYLTVETRGYLRYQGEPFTAREGDGIHVNIELRRGMLDRLDLSDVLVLLFGAVLSLILIRHILKGRI